jgi:hypothetical protein
VEANFNVDVHALYLCRFLLHDLTHLLPIEVSLYGFEYADIHKLAILADVAPYSREYNTWRQKVGAQARGNTELEIEYEKILRRLKQTLESVIRMSDRHFTAPVDEISGTVEEVSG